MYPNQKPWMNKKVHLLLKAPNDDLDDDLNNDLMIRSGDAQAYSTARANLRRGIKMAKYC